MCVYVCVCHTIDVVCGSWITNTRVGTFFRIKRRSIYHIFRHVVISDDTYSIGGEFQSGNLLRVSLFRECLVSSHYCIFSTFTKYTVSLQCSDLFNLYLSLQYRISLGCGIKHKKDIVILTVMKFLLLHLKQVNSIIIIINDSLRQSRNGSINGVTFY